MHSFMDAKLMAKLLRQGLAEHAVDLSHGACLDLVARQFGLDNWNILSARIEAASAEDVVPEGWIRSGHAARHYRVGVDRQHRAAWIETRPDIAARVTEDDFCTLMQSVDASRFRGQRLRLASELKAEGVDGGVTLWFRIDGPLGSLRFENLERYSTGGPLSGDTGWTGRQIVLDVPQEATTLNYGFYVKGRGRGLARAFDLAEVDANHPVNTPDTSALKGPTNLDFAA